MTIIILLLFTRKIALKLVAWRYHRLQMTIIILLLFTRKTALKLVAGCYHRLQMTIITKRLEKKLDGNFTRMLRAILNKSWRQHPTRNQLYGHLPPSTKTIQAWRTRYAGHCRRNKDELISDVLLWTPAYGQAKAGRPARIYIQQLCEDTGCGPEDLPEARNDREKWQERVRDIRASGTTWWWWLLLFTRKIASVLNNPTKVTAVKPIN